MLHMRLAASAIAIVATSVIPASLTFADPIDPRIEEIIDKGQQLVEAGSSAYLDLEVEALIDGQVGMRMGQDVWIGEMDRIRVDSTLGSIACVTREGSLIHDTESNVCLRLTPETVEALGDDAGAARAAFTFGSDMMVLWELWDAGECMEVVGEETVDGVEYWLIGLSGRLFDAWSGVPQQVGGDFTVDSIVLCIDKEEATPRRLTIEMSGPAKVSVVVSILAIEVGVDIPDHRFEYDVPDDALVIEWDPEKDPTGNMSAFRSAVAAARQAQPQQ